MTAAITDASETQRLSNVLAVIEQQTKVLERKRVKGSEELINYRKYMWEDAAMFDRAERVQTENVALTQERAVMDVALRLKRLSKLSYSPYFGRIDFRETGLDTILPVYVGLHGLIEDNEEILIHDWRAPISGMFYDYEVGPAQYDCPEGTITGDLTLKRQYKIESGRMLYMFDSSLAIHDQILRDALARNTTEKMRQIVNSIQKEQNAIIRSEGSKVLIVQGPAGSGKTSIAMHRAAYLLYRHRGHVAANNLLIFSPNEVFADYISNVLPELGEENIREATFEDYARSILDKKLTFETRAEQMEFVLSDATDANTRLRKTAIAFKSSPAFLRILRRYARYLKFTNLKFTDIRVNEALVMKAAKVKELYKEFCWDRPLVPGIERLKDRVLANSIYSTSIAERRIEQEVEKVLVTRDPVRLYRDMFKDPEIVRKLAEGEQIPDDLDAICRLTLKNLRGKRIPHEDVAPILLIKRLVDGEPRYANIKHLIIDEAQDYTPVHYEIIRNLFGGSSVTILGDLSQRVNAYSGLDTYDALKQSFGKDTSDVLRLTKSYRSTQEITDFAHAMLKDVERVDNIRSTGRKPVIAQAKDQELTDLISDEMDRLKADGLGSIAVICKTATEAMTIYSKLLSKHDVRLVEAGSITFHHGLVVLPAYLAKGLEFDAVIIHDAGARLYGSDSERTLLYTACTRALHSLTVYYTGDPSPLLPLNRRELFATSCKSRLIPAQ